MVISVSKIGWKACRTYRRCVCRLMNTDTGDILASATFTSFCGRDLAASAGFAASRAASAASILGCASALTASQLRLRFGQALGLPWSSTSSALSLRRLRASGSPRPQARLGILDLRLGPVLGALGHAQVLREPRRIGPALTAAAWPLPPFLAAASAWAALAAAIAARSGRRGRRGRRTLPLGRHAEPHRAAIHCIGRRLARRAQAPPPAAPGRGLKSAGCAMSTGVMSSRTTTTRMPILVRSNSCSAKPCGMRMQPCDAGWPGSTPACSAIPDQVMRCMKGMEASS